MGSAPPDGLELDNSPDTHAAIPYFAAAQLVLYDDAYRYRVLRSEYESRVASLRPGVRIEEAPIADVYGFEYFEGVD